MPSLRGEILFKEEWQESPVSSQAAELIEKIIAMGTGPGEMQSVAELSFSASAGRLAVENDIVTAESVRPFLFSLLPEGYGVKGGAARAELAHLVGQVDIMPRDLDLIRFGAAKLIRDEDVAREYMPNDYRHGAKVEIIGDLHKYLSSRDLTVNEVLVNSGKLQASPFALLDTLSFTLRASKYRSGTMSKAPAIAAGTFLKMLRLRAERAVVGEAWRIVGVPEKMSIDDFTLALHLEKALQRNVATGELFLSYCAQCDLLPNVSSPFLPAVLSELAHFAVGANAALKSIPEDMKKYCTAGDHSGSRKS